MIANLLTVVLVVACFVGISLLKKIQKNGLITLKEEAAQFELEQMDKESSGEEINMDNMEEKMNNIMAASGPKIISAACAGVVIVVNALLLNVVRRFALFEKNHTQTSMNVSVAFKLTIARFINSSLVLVYANWDGDWFKQGSLVYDATILCISLAFTYPITYALNIAGLVKSFKKWRAKSDENITQREANILCEGVPLDVANNISNYMNCVMTCIFYSPIIPHAVPIALMGSCISYWSYKYNLLRNHNNPDMLSEFMTTFFANMMPFVGLLWAFSFSFFIEVIMSHRKMSGSLISMVKNLKGNNFDEKASGDLMAPNVQMIPLVALFISCLCIVLPFRLVI